jgi:cytochrome c-type biogenesis protein CcmE
MSSIDIVDLTDAPDSGSRSKFLIGGLLIVVAIAFLIVSSTKATAQYFMTIDELIANEGGMLERDIKISGAVIGESIAYEAETLTLRFKIVNMPADLDEINAAGGLAEVLRQVVTDPSASSLEVVYIGPRPDLLRHEAQAIITGRLGEDGLFHADKLLLKCPTRYESDIPVQAEE